MPLYFNCFFFDKENKNIVRTYKIENSKDPKFPFQLYQQTTEYNLHAEWRDLSNYVSLSDCVRTFLKELCSKELLDEVYHGQATMNPAEILNQIELGKSIVSIYNDTSGISQGPFDVAFKNLVELR